MVRPLPKFDHSYRVDLVKIIGHMEFFMKIVSAKSSMIWYIVTFGKKLFNLSVYERDGLILKNIFKM